MAEWIDYLYENVSNVEPHEPPSDYKPGGFHPVTLHDTFQDERYVVRHKLGFGGQATVWLAWDTSQKYVEQSILQILRPSYCHAKSSCTHYPSLY